MTIRRFGEWLAVLLCAGSFAAYVYHSLAFAKYVRMYGRLLGIVKGRGGQILAPGFVAYKTWLNLRCARGHVWKSPPESIETFL